MPAKSLFSRLMNKLAGVDETDELKVALFVMAGEVEDPTEHSTPNPPNDTGQAFFPSPVFISPYFGRVLGFDVYGDPTMPRDEISVRQGDREVARLVDISWHSPR